MFKFGIEFQWKGKPSISTFIIAKEYDAAYEEALALEKEEGYASDSVYIGFELWEMEE